MRKSVAILAMLGLVLSGTLGAVHPSFASTPGSQIYVTNSGSSPDTVSVMDGSTNTVTTTIPVGSDPFGAAFDPANGYVYVANAFDGTVSVIDQSSNTVIATVTVGGSPLAVAFDSLNGDIYVANAADGTVSVIDGSSNTVTATVTVGTGPQALAFDSLNGDIYVANTIDGTVSVVDGSTNTVTATVTVGTAPQAVAFDSILDYIYVANGDGSISIIDGIANTLMAPAYPGGNLVGIAFDPSNGDIYASQGGPVGFVLVIDPAQFNTVLTGVPVGNSPTALAYDPTSGDIYVANNGDGTVSVIDGNLGSQTENGVLATVPVGGFPQGIAVAFSTTPGDVLAWCEGLSPLVATVSGSTCTVNSSVSMGQGVVIGNGETLQVQGSVILTIEYGVTLTVDSGGEMDIFSAAVINYGTINNEVLAGPTPIPGIIALEGGGATLDNQGTINNSGTIVEFLDCAITGVAIDNLPSGYLVHYYEVSGTLDQTLCQTYGGSWTGTSSTAGTCTVFAVNWYIDRSLAGSPTAFMIVPQGVTLVVGPQLINVNTGIYDDGAPFTNYGTITNQGSVVLARSNQLNMVQEVFNNYGTLDNTATGGFDNAGGAPPEVFTNEVGGSVTNEGTFYNYKGNSAVGAEGGTVVNLGTFTNTGTVNNWALATFNNLASISNTGAINNQGVFNEYCGATLGPNPVVNTGSGSLNTCTSTVQGSSQTTISGGSASSGPITDTGVTVGISGSSAQTGTSVTINAQVLTSFYPYPDVQVSGSYYDVNIQGISDGSANICIIASTPISGLPAMDYYDAPAVRWVSATSVYGSGYEVCGTIPVSALSGTPIVIGTSSSQGTGGGTGVPEFPAVSALGPLLLVAFLLPALLVVRRKSAGRAPK